ncbi:MAG: exo-alpha-sialidase [Specibacter sp.]
MTQSFLPYWMSGSPWRRRLGSAAVCAAILAAGVLAPPAQAAPTDPPGSFTEQDLAPTLTSPFGAYRIPALTYLGANVVVAAWDGRPGGAYDSPNPNSIVMRRSTDGGATWSNQATVLAGNQDLANSGAAKDGYSDPSFVYDSVANKLFLFSVYSKDQGFPGSVFGNDDANRQVISAQVSESDDGGLSWGAPRLITSVVKPGTSTTNPQPGDVRAMFASSGEGIQLKYGTHAGRLIQQFAGDVRQSDGSNKIQAYSVYSDDHGATWTRGTPVGDRMDENKTVELSNGTVMLNSRDNANLGYRKVAISTDGGQTYGAVTQDTELPDPANNGSITRLFPDAATGTADAKKLLFTNANSQTGRQNVSARVSCDDGASWASVRTIRSGFSAYSTATRLGSGQIGVLYETSYSTGINMAQFDDAWLNYLCIPMTAANTTISAGTTGTSNITLTNEETTSQAGLALAFTAPTGWTVTATTIPTLAPGAGTATTATVQVPSSATPGSYTVTATTTSASGTTSQRDFTVTVPNSGAVTIGGVQITGARNDASRNLSTNPYVAGDTVSYKFSVTNTTSGTVAVVPTSGNLAPFVPPSTGNCRYSALAAGASYTCSTPLHTVTSAEASQGYFVPDTNWTITGTGSTSGRVLGSPVVLNGNLQASSAAIAGVSIAGVRNDPGRNIATNPYSAGETVAYKFTVSNTTAATVAVVPTAGNFAPFLPPGTGNCRYSSLAAGAGYTCSTPLHTVTAAEAAQGYFIPDTSWNITAGTTTTGGRLTGDPVLLK